MARKNEQRTAVLPDRYKELVAESIRRLRAEVGDYHFKTQVVSALDGAIFATWSQEDSPVRVVRRDRFPAFGRLTPDFAFEFSNGYLLIGEYKKHWQVRGRDAKDLGQLSSYRDLVRIEDDKRVQDRRGDVLLLIQAGGDEVACEAIADDPRLGSGTVIVAEARIDGQRMNGETVNFVYRRFGGTNGKFLAVNAGPMGTEHDLNHHFVERRGFPARCDAEALLEAGECPFINDTPPTPYTLVNILLPILNDKLSDGERDTIAADRWIDVPIGFAEVLEAATKRYKRVPEGKLRSWINDALNTLVSSRVARRQDDETGLKFVFRLDGRLERLNPEKVYDKLARREIGRRYVKISNATPSGQYVIDFEMADE